MGDERYAEGKRERHVCRCGSPCWIVYHGPQANHTLEPDFSRAEAAERERDELREAVTMLLDAVLPLMPISGSWMTGYKVSERIDPTLRASVEEWEAAAYYFCEAHKVAALSGGATREEHPCTSPEGERDE